MPRHRNIRRGTIKAIGHQLGVPEPHSRTQSGRARPPHMTSPRHGRAMPCSLSGPRDRLASMTALSGILTALGGACQFVGLGLVVKEIADDRAQARRLFVARQWPTRPRRRYPGRAIPRTARLFTGAPVLLSPSEQQRAVLQGLHNLDAATANALVEIRKALDSELDASVDALRSEIVASDTELRSHLRYVLAGSIRNRALGAALLGAGILLEIVGAIVGVLAS